MIESPNFPGPYPHARDCLWTIAAPRGNKVNITFSHFEVEELSSVGNGTCIMDYVEIFESDQEVSCAKDRLIKNKINGESHLQEDGTRTSLGRFCGLNLVGLPPIIATSKQFAFVKFVADMSVAENGFRLATKHKIYQQSRAFNFCPFLQQKFLRLEYTINGCGGKFVNKGSGRIASPNYPNVYPLSIECIWTIQVTYTYISSFFFDEKKAIQCFIYFSFLESSWHQY